MQTNLNSYMFASTNSLSPSSPIFTQAYKRRMYGEAYVWLLHYGNDPMWMTRNMTDTDADYDSCTSEEISKAAEGHFVTRDITLREDGVMPLAGQVDYILTIGLWKVIFVSSSLH